MSEIRVTSPRKHITASRRWRRGAYQNKALGPSYEHARQLKVASVSVGRLELADREARLEEARPGIEGRGRRFRNRG